MSLHDALSWTGIAPALVLAQAAADERIFFRSIGLRLRRLSSLQPRGSECLLLEFQIGGLDDVGEDLDVAIDFLAELLAGTAAGVDRHRLELIAHPRIGQCAPGLRSELVGDRERRAGRDE